ncbi:MAG: N-acetyltransferase [Sphingobacteriales bacterium]|nr:MAG: N-acetyltransferase [Sphingobacteriales bacterium]
MQKKSWQTRSKALQNGRRNWKIWCSIKPDYLNTLLPTGSTNPSSMTETCFTPFPVLSTSRLVLRALKETDDEAIFTHRNDDLVNRYLLNWRHGSIEDSRAFIRRVLEEISNGHTILWVLTENGSDRFLGTVCLWNISWEEGKAETGYTLLSALHGKGLMQEALQAVLHYGFSTLRLNLVDAYTHRENIRSIRLLERMGFNQAIPARVPDVDRIYLRKERLPKLKTSMER